jgi:hypothetical protein
LVHVPDPRRRPLPRLTGGDSESEPDMVHLREVGTAVSTVGTGALSRSVGGPGT